MGLALVFGIFCALGGVTFLGEAIVLLIFGIKKKKILLFVVSGLLMILSLPFSVLGGYIVYDILKYIAY